MPEIVGVSCWAFSFAIGINQWNSSSSPMPTKVLAGDNGDGVFNVSWPVYSWVMKMCLICTERLCTSNKYSWKLGKECDSLWEVEEIVFLLFCEMAKPHEIHSHALLPSLICPCRLADHCCFSGGACIDPGSVHCCQQSQKVRPHLYISKTHCLTFLCLWRVSKAFSKSRVAKHRKEHPLQSSVACSVGTQVTMSCTGHTPVFTLTWNHSHEFSSYMNCLVLERETNCA